MPPLSADELPLDENEDPAEEEGLDGNVCELFLANNWSCVSEANITNESVSVAIIIVNRIIFDPIILSSCKCCI
jgi:hypothetical protein